MISILYIEKNSNYNVLKNSDLWDEKRNALLFSGKNVIIAHPPCRLWSRLRSFSTAGKCEMLCGINSILLARSNGGIVENPFPSKLWDVMQVGTPLKPDKYGGYLVKINMSDFGFPARKPTALYICGIDYKDLPAPPLNFNRIDFTISSSKGSKKKELKKNSRSTTTFQLIKYLLKVAYLISINKKSKKS